MKWVEDIDESLVVGHNYASLGDHDKLLVRDRVLFPVRSADDERAKAVLHTAANFIKIHPRILLNRRFTSITEQFKRVRP
jgi:hypothetical protein